MNEHERSGGATKGDTHGCRNCRYWPALGRSKRVTTAAGTALALTPVVFWSGPAYRFRRNASFRNRRSADHHPSVAAVPVHPKIVQPIPAPASAAKPVAVPQAERIAPPPSPPPLTQPVRSEPPRVAAPEPKASFEMRLGTYWLVRIGAVLVLTGLVFFGNLAYQKLGAPGKVGLLYLALNLMFALVRGGNARRSRNRCRTMRRCCSRADWRRSISQPMRRTTSRIESHLKRGARWNAASRVGWIHGLGGRSKEIGGPRALRGEPGVLCIRHYTRRFFHVVLKSGAHHCRCVFPRPQSLGRTLMGEPRRDLRGVCLLAILPWRRLVLA